MSRAARTRLGLAIALLLSLGLLAPASAPAERTIALSTGKIELALPPGGIANESIRVANNGDEPFKALIYTSDVFYDEEGQPSYVKPSGEAGEYLRSPASWLSLRAPDTTKIIANVPYIEMDPGDEFVVDFELRVPEQATPGDYNSVVFFEMFEHSGTDSGAVSRVAGRIGARVVLRVEGYIVDDIDVAPFSVRPIVIGDVVPYSFRVSNNGNIDKRYVPSLVVLDRNEVERMRSQVETGAVVYARNQREYVGGLKLKNATLGRFTMRVEVDYDKETSPDPGNTQPTRIAKHQVFWVVPLWFAVAAVVGVGTPALWLSWRSTARSYAKRERVRQETREEA